MYAGRPATHPVFVALRQTVTRHELPQAPFDNLITAFVQDQTVTRYRNWEELDGYCVNSANPVGRLVLMLCGYRDEERFRLSDATCTALQLANFWQDVTVDLAKGRIYLPLHLFELHGYTVEELHARNAHRLFAPSCATPWSARNSSSSRACRWCGHWTGGWRWTSTCSTAAACVSSRRSAHRTTTCCAAVPPSRAATACCCLLGSLWRVALMRTL